MGGANDNGFAKQSDGRYLAYISEYDRSVRARRGGMRKIAGS